MSIRWASCAPRFTRRDPGPGQPEPKRLVTRASCAGRSTCSGSTRRRDGAAIKAQYKTLVKRFHPDANGGDRSFEERLRDIIRAHDALSAAGLC